MPLGRAERGSAATGRQRRCRLRSSHAGSRWWRVGPIMIHTSGGARARTRRPARLLPPARHAQTPVQRVYIIGWETGLRLPLPVPPAPPRSGPRSQRRQAGTLAARHAGEYRRGNGRAVGTTLRHAAGFPAEQQGVSAPAPWFPGHSHAFVRRLGAANGPQYPAGKPAHQRRGRDSGLPEPSSSGPQSGMFLFFRIRVESGL